MKKDSISRRTALNTIATGAVAGGLGLLQNRTATAQEGAKKRMNGRIKQSVSLWCYGKTVDEIGLDGFCKACADMGLVGVDLVTEPQYETLKKFGLVPTMSSEGAGGISNGLNEKANHKKCMEQFKTNIAKAKKFKLENIITFSGNRRNLSDEEGMDNCALILKDVVKMAEDAEVTICMELLNSKVNHKDYMCDHTAWGVELCKRVGSRRLKLLNDLYHMQIMEGDLIRNIQDFPEYFGHYHTGGNPGRNEIDETQEIYYPAVMKAIAETGYTGYVAHEFVPLRDPLTSLRQAVELCDV